ncbi:MAG: 6-bladed beta-propeller [bacterium]
MKRLTTLSLTLLIAAAAAAGAQEPMVVANPFEAAGPAPTLEVLTVVGESGPDEALFYTPGHLNMGPDGTLYVTDRGNKAIHMYAPDGTFLGRIGQEGGGPGEFQMPAGSWFTPDGLLAVKDMMNQRTSYFRPDGEFLRSEPLDGMLMTSAVLEPLGDGTYLTANTGGMVVMRREGPGGAPSEPPFLEVVDGEGRSLKSFGERKPVEDRRAGMLVNSVSIAGHRGQVAAAFRFADDIRIYDVKSGQVDMIITRELAFTPREPKLEMQTRDVGEGNVAVRATAAADPVTLDVAFDPDGRLWVITSLFDEAGTGEREETGEYAGLVRMEVYGGDGRMIAAWTLDEPANQMAFAPDGSLWLLDSQYTNTARHCAVRWP